VPWFVLAVDMKKWCTCRELGSSEEGVGIWHCADMDRRCVALTKTGHPGLGGHRRQKTPLSGPIVVYEKGKKIAGTRKAIEFGGDGFSGEVTDETWHTGESKDIEQIVTRVVHRRARTRLRHCT